MAKKNKKINFYSTDPDTYFNDEDDEIIETLEAKDQQLRVMLDRKKRNGKEVSLVTGFVGNENDLKDLGKLLKSRCGVGGSVKDNEIIIQGNLVSKILEILLKEGYIKSKKKGG